MTFPLRISIISKLAPMLNEGWAVGEENKLRPSKNFVPLQETPWKFHNVNFLCVKWYRAFFELVSDETMAHSHCHDCYKIMAAPRTLTELKIIEAYQMQTTVENPDIHCKCGIDVREFVPSLYTAAWYTRSLEEANERYGEIRKMFKDIFKDDPPDLYIKKACTEFERAIGPSDQYVVTEQQERLEEKLDDAMEFDPFQSLIQPQLIVERVHEAWMNFTWAYGEKGKDEVTAMLGGTPLERPIVRYNKEENDE